PATGCWWNLPVSSMRRAAQSRCNRRCPSGTPGVAADSRIELRIGINLGDVIVEGDDLYGDGPAGDAPCTDRRCSLSKTSVSRKSGSHWTHRWRKGNSNPWSLSRKIRRSNVSRGTKG